MVNCLKGKGLNQIKPALEELLKEKLERYKAKGLVNVVIRVTVYECANCSECPLKEKCIRQKKTDKTPIADRVKRLNVSKYFVAQREAMEEKISTEEGILLRITADYQAAGFYDLRLKLSEAQSLVHVNEYLYSEVELDTRKTGERLFDYVDPKNRQSQVEMEQACTEHLKAVGAYLAPGAYKPMRVDEGAFPVEASIMIPVRKSP